MFFLFFPQKNFFLFFANEILFALPFFFRALHISFCGLLSMVFLILAIFIHLKGKRNFFGGVMGEKFGFFLGLKSCGWSFSLFFIFFYFFFPFRRMLFFYWEKIFHPFVIIYYFKNFIVKFCFLLSILSFVPRLIPGGGNPFVWVFGIEIPGGDKLFEPPWPESQMVKTPNFYPKFCLFNFSLPPIQKNQKKNL